MVNYPNGNHRIDTFYVKKCPTGINEITKLGNIEVYPNPCHGIFSINIQNIKDKAIIDIYSILGEITYSYPLTPGISQINLSNEPTGLYMYRVITNQGILILSGKVMLEK